MRCDTVIPPSFIPHATGWREPVPEGSAGLWTLREVWFSAIRICSGLHQKGAWDQPVQPTKVPPDPSPFPGTGA